MPAIRKLSKEASQVIEWYKNGGTIREIAKFYHVAPGTIRNVLLRHNEALRKRGRRKKQKIEASGE